MPIDHSIDIKTIFPTPLHQKLVSHLNNLSQCTLPIYKFIIDLTLSKSIYNNNFQLNTELNSLIYNKLSTIFKNQKLSLSIESITISMKEITFICKRYIYINLLNYRIWSILSNLSTIYNNNNQNYSSEQSRNLLVNIIKYLKLTFVQNTVIADKQLDYLTQNINTVMLRKIEFIQSNNIMVRKQKQTHYHKKNMVQWGIFNLKRTQVIKHIKTNSQENIQKTDQGNSSLQEINKIYVKLSLQDSSCQVNKLLNSKLSYNPINKSSMMLGQTFSKIPVKVFTLSLIDFRLLMQEMQIIKSLGGFI